MFSFFFFFLKRVGMFDFNKSLISRQCPFINVFCKAPRDDDAVDQK